MTRWYLDTEFNENGRTIELISLALVSEVTVPDGSAAGRGRELSFYVINQEINEARIRDENPWVGEHVLPKLPLRGDGDGRGGFGRGSWMSRSTMAAGIEALLLPDPEVEVWGYFSDYDWVVFCQLFGRMVDLPKGMPMFCHDLKQEMKRLGVKKDALPKQDAASEHGALADARWIKDAHKALREIEEKRGGPRAGWSL